jgi:hypothetical protein
LTTIQHLSREEAVTERGVLLRSLLDRFGTTDRDQLRELSLAGAMSDADIESVERVRSLDFLLGE